MIRLSEHKRNNFQTCRFKYKMSLEWQAKIKPYPMALGILVQDALMVWDLTGDEDKAVDAMLKSLEKIEVEEPDKLLEEASYLLDGYFNKYRDTLDISLATEIPFGKKDAKLKVFLAPGVEFTGRMDGISSQVGISWVKERKTSGQAPGQFWKKYELDPQSIGYVYAARQLFPDFPVKGVMIDAIFRQNYKNPEPKYERQFFEIGDDILNRWHEMMIQLAQDMEEAKAKDTYYSNWGACHAYFGECEYWGYCTSKYNQAVLESTHAKIERESQKGSTDLRVIQ